MRSEKIKAHLALLACNSTWALGYPIYAILMPKYISPLALVTISMAATLVLVQGDYWLRRAFSKGGDTAKPIERGDWWWMFLAAFLIAILRKGSLIFGLSLTSAVDASVIATLTPVMVLIISVATGRERFNWMKSLGLLLSFGGAIAIVTTAQSAHRETSSLLGNLLMFGLVIATGFYMVTLRGIFNKYGSTTVLRHAYTIAALIFLPIGFEEVLKVDFSAMSWHVWLLLAFVVWVPTYVPNLLLNYGLKSVNYTVASIYGYAQPVIAILVSVLVGIEKIHLDTVLFAVMVLCGVAIVTRARASTQGKMQH